MITPEENAQAPYALDEEGEAPQLDPAGHQVRANDPTHRRLRAIAGAGNGYIFAIVPGPEAHARGEQVSLAYSGFYPDAVPVALRELAAGIEEQLEAVA